MLFLDKSSKYAINNKNWTLNYILYNKENENINIRNIEYPDDLYEEKIYYNFLKKKEMLQQ